MLRQHSFGCNRVEICPNSFNLDFSMPYSKFPTFLHLKAYGGALLCMEINCMSCYSRLLRPLKWLSFWEYHNRSWKLQKFQRSLYCQYFVLLQPFRSKNAFISLCVILKSSYLRTLNLIKYCSNKAGHSNSYEFSPCVIMQQHMP